MSGKPEAVRTERRQGGGSCSDDGRGKFGQPFPPLISHTDRVRNSADEVGQQTA